MKVALCIPIHGRPETRFMANLLELMLHTLKVRPDIELKPNVASSSDITTGRHYLVKQAFAWGVDWLLWLDADMAFEPDALVRLLDRNVDFVGCNYRRKGPPHLFTASRGKTIIETTRERAVEMPVEQIDHVGLGLALVSAAAVGKLDPPFPMFSFIPCGDGTAEGEDAFFCMRLRSVGVPIHVDHELSLEVGHIGEQVIYAA